MQKAGLSRTDPFRSWPSHEVGSLIDVFLWLESDSGLAGERVMARDRVEAPTERYLDTVRFGAPAAERDITQGLSDYFVESGAFNRVSDGRKTVLLGNRGSGKSAIFKVLAERQRSPSVVIELAPEDYSYEMLSSLMAREDQGSWAKLGAYAVARKYLIFVLVMKGLNERGLLKSSDGDAIRKYLRDHHAGEQKTPIALLISYLKRVEGVKIAKYEVTMKTRQLEHLYKLEEIQGLLPALGKLCARHRVLVFVDELDRGWDASEDARAFVAGLFQACATINGLSDGLKVYMSLRQELYDSIPELYEDAQKYRDVIEVINWDEPSLNVLVEKRIRHSIPSLASGDPGKAWGAIFAETLDYRQTKSFNYMIDRTLYRPREIIQFCTQAVETTQERRGSTPIDYSMLREAEVTYSDDRAKDIAAEYRFQYPGLSDVFDVFRGQSYLFSRDDLEMLCLSMAVGETQTGSASGWVNDADPEKVIETLWQVGFLRAQAVGGVKARRRSGSSYLGPHQVANLNLRNITRPVHDVGRPGGGLIRGGRAARLAAHGSLQPQLVHQTLHRAAGDLDALAVQLAPDLAGPVEREVGRVDACDLGLRNAAAPALKAAIRIETPPRR
jgi:hypothetical protein